MVETTRFESVVLHRSFSYSLLLLRSLYQDVQRERLSLINVGVLTEKSCGPCAQQRTIAGPSLSSLLPSRWLHSAT